MQKMPPAKGNITGKSSELEVAMRNYSLFGSNAGATRSAEADMDAITGGEDIQKPNAEESASRNASELRAGSAKAEASASMVAHRIKKKTPPDPVGRLSSERGPTAARIKENEEGGKAADKSEDETNLLKGLHPKTVPPVSLPQTPDPKRACPELQPRDGQPHTLYRFWMTNTMMTRRR